MPIAASYDGYSPLDPCGRGSAAHSRKKAPLAPLTTATTTAGGVYHTADGQTEGVRVACKEASSNGVIPAAAAASIGEVGACATTVGNVATAADCITLCQETPVVTASIATVAVADACLPLDRNATLGTGGGPGARIVTPISDQTRKIAATKAVISDARGGLEGRSFGTRVDSRTVAAATTDSVADARRE